MSVTLKKNISHALSIRYHKPVANEAISFIEQEEFDAEAIQDDIEDAFNEDDVLSCSLLEAVSNKFKNLFKTDESQKALLLILHNAVTGNMPQPMKYSLNIDAIKFDLTKKSRAETKKFISKHCSQLIKLNEKEDQALVDVLAMGTKNNIPLLNWLTDTYTRCRISHWREHKGKELEVGNFPIEYDLFKSLTQKNKAAVVNKLDSGIKSFYNRMYNQISFMPSQQPIDDNINEYVDYYIVMNEVIERLVSEYEVVPLQIDMWIIPNKVENHLENEDDLDEDDDGDDDDDDADDDDDDVQDKDKDEVLTGVDGANFIGSLDYRLRSNGFTFEKKEYNFSSAEYSKNIRQLTQQLQSISTASQRNQRYMIYVDRRNPKYQKISDKDFKESVKNGYSSINNMNDDQKAINDTIYIALSKNKIPDAHTPETSFSDSVNCMLPIIDIEKNRYGSDIGIRNNFNGYQFTLSWHIDTTDKIRCYWFNDCWGARLFPFDCIDLWPLAFKQSKKNKITKDRIKKLKNMRQIHDIGFKYWFENTTKQKLEI